MMKEHILALGLILFVSCSSCESLRQQVTPKGLTKEPKKLVVACFISPQDTVLAARISQSVPLLETVGSTDNDVLEAIVTLTDGIRSVPLLPQAKGSSGQESILFLAKAYELKITAGKSYTLTVSVLDGRSVISTCTVPGPVALESIALDSVVSDESGERRTDYYAQVRWQDPPGQTNFYRVAGYNDYQFVNELAGNSSERGRGNWYFNTSSLFTDAGRDGQAFLVTKGNLITPSRMVNGIRYVSRPVGQLTAILLNVDQNYYQYHEAIERQLQVGDNAFAEPALIPSTIIGGLGCFGAFNKSTLTVGVKL